MVFLDQSKNKIETFTTASNLRYTHPCLPHLLFKPQNYKVSQMLSSIKVTKCYVIFFINSLNQNLFSNNI